MAIVLSFVAGIVNIAGFLAINERTTNVTGHFAQIISKTTGGFYHSAWIYVSYIAIFTFGSFASSVLILQQRRKEKTSVFALPTIIEIILLIVIPLLSYFMYSSNVIISCMLLFTMGFQNAYVTKISNAVIRTTHVTGLFTDIGIELSQLLYSDIYPRKKHIQLQIKLRLYIIFSFVLGGFLSAFIYPYFKLFTTIFGAFILIANLLRWKTRTSS